MTRRNAIIPGLDPEIEVHGEMPPLAERDEARRFSAHDLRDDREKFGELANPVIDAFPARLNGPWWRFNSVACTVEDAVAHNRLIFHGGLPVMGIGNLRWEFKAAEVAQSGELTVPEPDVHYPGRTGLIVGRSSFNYYHFISDMLVFLEDLAPLMDRLGLDRIVINPCIDKPGGFQDQLVRAIYPELADRIVFSDGPFRADSLTFVNVWPQHFAHAEDGVPADGPPVKINGLKGVSRRAYRSTTAPFFDRVERITGSRRGADQQDVVIISRMHAPGRRIVNECELMEALAPYGARQVAMEHLSVREQMDLCAGARVVIGAHGAGMTNAGFCQAGAVCMELTGRHYLQRAPDFATFAMVRDIGYQFIVADEDGDIEKMSGNTGNDIRLGQPALDHIVGEVDAAIAAST